MDLSFWASLIKTDKKCKFITGNCTHVIGPFWIYEGCTEVLKDAVDDVEILSYEIIPCLGDLKQKEIIDGCEEWFFIDWDNIKESE